MKFFFLDVVDVVQAPTAGALGYSFYMVVIATIIVEAIVMLVMKYNLFGKSLLHSFLANGASLAVGFLLFELVPGLFDPYHVLKLVGMWLITIGIELPVIYQLNKMQPLRKTILMCLCMNTVTYILFWLYIHFII